jgi:hypothetical protein
MSTTSRSKVGKRETSPSNPKGFLFKIEIVQSCDQCSDVSCVFKKLLHYHCKFSKFCHYSTNQLGLMDTHLNDFHSKMDILENFDFFDRNFDCKLSGCCYNKVSLKSQNLFISKLFFNFPSNRLLHIIIAFCANFPFRCLPK